MNNKLTCLFIIVIVLICLLFLNNIKYCKKEIFKTIGKIKEEIKKPDNKLFNQFYEEKPLTIFKDIFEDLDPWSDRMEIDGKFNIYNNK